MSKSNATENSILLLIFNGTAWADLAENDTTSPATNLYVALHTADPTESGNATSFEASYSGPYARQAVPRSGSGWTVTGNSVTNADLIQFPQSSSSQTLTHFSITTASSGTSPILYSGELSASVPITSGGQPQFTAGQITITED